MYKKEEFRRKIDSLINNGSDMTDEHKFIWSEVFRNLADYQEELLSVRENKDNETVCDNDFEIVCGITDSNTLPKGFEFVSCADDLKSIRKSRNAEDLDIYDNKMNVLYTGYIDIQYNKISDYCGREKKYTGVLADGVTEFSYSLILQESLLHREKLLYSLFSFYKINIPVIYSPYFRRMIYVETDCKEAENGFELQLEKNGLDGLLKLNFRSIWNISISSNPASVKRGNSFYYNLEKNTFIFSEEKYEHEFDIEVNEDEDMRQVKITPKNAETNPKNYMIKAEINRADDYAVNSFMNGYGSVNRGQYPENISHIYSKADVHMIMREFADTVNFIDVYTERPENMTVCSYEKHFEYPLFMPFFRNTARPVLYLNFENDRSRMLYDRIVYTVHQVQRLFPEYIWKGGYIK